ncbi:RICIN domain-containing protein [Streptomyces sp. NPDC020917]|uniref:RICIN domain-containing protein n=1 Tax=Streptomyces sp. NPDC020917 TaxID=3365102 RepID=UPI0037AD894A
MLQPKRRRRLSLIALLTSILGVLAIAGVTAPDASALSGNFLQNQYTALCLSIPGNNYYDGQVVDQYGCGGYGDQYWMTSGSDSHPGFYYVVLSEDQNLCLTHLTPFQNSQLTVSWCGWDASQGTLNQLWYNVYDSSFGANEMRSWVDDWCLSIPGANTGWSVPVNTWPCGPYPDQHWAFV